MARSAGINCVNTVLATPHAHDLKLLPACALRPRSQRGVHRHHHQSRCCTIKHRDATLKPSGAGVRNNCSPAPQQPRYTEKTTLCTNGAYIGQPRQPRQGTAQDTDTNISHHPRSLQASGAIQEQDRSMHVRMQTSKIWLHSAGYSTHDQDLDPSVKLEMQMA